MENDKSQARQRMREVAERTLPSGDLAGFFETVYTTANGKTNEVPWADLQPHPLALEWFGQRHLEGAGRNALVGSLRLCKAAPTSHCAIAVCRPCATVVLTAMP